MGATQGILTWEVIGRKKSHVATTPSKIRRKNITPAEYLRPLRRAFLLSGRCRNLTLPDGRPEYSGREDGRPEDQGRIALGGVLLTWEAPTS